jgi:hypothetical protein
MAVSIRRIRPVCAGEGSGIALAEASGQGPPGGATLPGEGRR